MSDKQNKAVARSAIDTVARRLIVRRAASDDINHYLHEFVDINEADWELVIKRAWELTQEIDNGQQAFDASYKFLKEDDNDTPTQPTA